MMSAAVGSQINIKECNLGASIGLGWFWFDCKQIFAFSKIFWEKWILDENQVNLLIFQWPALIYLAWFQFFFFQMMGNFQSYPKSIFVLIFVFKCWTMFNLIQFDQESNHLCRYFEWIANRTQFPPNTHVFAKTTLNQKEKK